jgi:broad-specificity NMP kinase
MALAGQGECERIEIVLDEQVEFLGRAAEDEVTNRTADEVDVAAHLRQTATQGRRRRKGMEAVDQLSRIDEHRAMIAPGARRCS